MSYYQNSKEEFIIINVNEDTAAFTISVKKYIQDLLKGIRIESLDKFSMELTVDDKLIIGDYVSDDNQKGLIYLKSIQLDEEGMNSLIENLEFHKNIHLKIEYDGMFYYFYHYGINRFGELLDDSLKGYVTFTAVEEQEDVLRAYQFREYEGKLVNGLIKDQDYRNYRHIKDWKIDQFYFYLCLTDLIPWDIYYAVEKEAYRISAKYDLKLEFESFPPFAEDVPMADPGALVFDRLYINNSYEYGKKTMTMEEIESFYDDVAIVYDILKDYVSMLSDQIKLIPLHKKDGKAVLRMKIDEDKNLVLSVFYPEVDTLECSPYETAESRVKNMEALLEEWDDVKIPFEKESLE